MKLTDVVEVKDFEALWRETMPIRWFAVYLKRNWCSGTASHNCPNSAFTSSVADLQ